MRITETGFDGLLVIHPDVYVDSRGYFFESYHSDKFKKAGIGYTFVQDNHSMSHKGVLRGLHFQNPPYAQGKLVKVLSGSVLDIVVDIRKNSTTFGKNYAITLNAKEHTILWIPPGFAHGFVALEDNTIFHYKCTNLYNKESEGGIIYNDPELALNWGIEAPIVSDKDKILPLIKNVSILF